MACLIAIFAAAAIVLTTSRDGTRSAEVRDSPKPTSSPPPARAGWNAVWWDEFDQESVDDSRWTVLDESTFGDGNGELACLTNRPENVKTRDGQLVITAQREASALQCGETDERFPQGRNFSSGFLETRHKVAFRYGRFEFSARSPTSAGTSQGLWPAIWLRPESGGVGEIDVMEIVGTPEFAQPIEVSQTIHFDYVGTHPHESSSQLLPNSDSFHTYALEWSPGELRWYIDDKQVFERSESTTSWLDEAFTGEFFLRVNLAVGGDHIGKPDGSTAFPAEFLVDYVRVYQRSTD